MDVTELKSSLKPETALFWMEVASNPLIKVFDLQKIITAVKQYNENIVVVVDNTFLTPYIVRPLDFGADVVFHSCTKYLGGHSDIIMGCLITNNDQMFEVIKDIQRCRGATPSPFDCYLLSRSLQTLEIRMEKHHKTGLEIANFLENHECVETVFHPLLKSHSDYVLAMKQNSGLHSGMIAFKILGGKQEAIDFLEFMNVIARAPSLGSTHSLACQPTSVTHIFLTMDEKQESGITDNLIRISIGLENSLDLVNDLDQALRRAVKKNYQQGRTTEC